MDSSFNMYREWFEAKKSQNSSSCRSQVKIQKVTDKWHAPEPGGLKLNVDASVFPTASTFSVGMVIRNHQGSFVAGKVISLPMIDSVVEAETVGISEALSWIKMMDLQDTAVLIESDSMLAVNSITSGKENLLEVGEITEECKQKLGDLHMVSVVFVRRNANRVAHEIARLPCLVQSDIIFTSPPTCLLEALSFDLLS